MKKIIVTMLRVISMLLFIGVIGCCNNDSPFTIIIMFGCFGIGSLLVAAIAEKIDEKK